MARTVVSNVEVLTAGTRYDQEEAKDGKAQRSTVVTLAVLPRTASASRWRPTKGKISLALRNPLDVEPTDDHGHQARGADEGHRARAGARRAEAAHGAGQDSRPPAPAPAAAADLQGRNDSRRQADGRGGSLTWQSSIGSSCGMRALPRRCVRRATVTAAHAAGASAAAADVSRACR